MTNKNKVPQVTPERVAQLRVEALKTPEQRQAEFDAARAAANTQDPEVAQRATNEALDAYYKRERRARAAHKLKRVVSFGMVGSYQDSKDKKHTRAEALRDKVHAAERTALAADPEYSGVMAEHHRDTFNGEAAQYLLDKSVHGSNLREAAAHNRLSREASDDGDVEGAALYAKLAAEKQGDALGHMQGHVDNASQRDFGIGRPYDVATEQQTMAGLHSLALEENGHRGQAAPDDGAHHQ